MCLARRSWLGRTCRDTRAARASSRSRRSRRRGRSWPRGGSLTEPSSKYWNCMGASTGCGGCSRWPSRSSCGCRRGGSRGWRPCFRSIQGSMRGRHCNPGRAYKLGHNQALVLARSWWMNRTRGRGNPAWPRRMGRGLGLGTSAGVSS